MSAVVLFCSSGSTRAFEGVSAAPMPRMAAGADVVGELPAVRLYMESSDELRRLEPPAAAISMLTSSSSSGSEPSSPSLPSESLLPSPSDGPMPVPELLGLALAR